MSGSFGYGRQAGRWEVAMSHRNNSPKNTSPRNNSARKTPPRETSPRKTAHNAADGNAESRDAADRSAKSRHAKSGSATSHDTTSFRVSGQNLDIGDALRERIGARIAEAMSKYFDGGYSGRVTLARDGFGFRAECAIHLDSKITLHAEGMAQDAYASADQVAVRIEKRLRRYHRRLKDHRPERERAAAEAASYVIAAPEPADDAEADAFTPVIIAETTTTLRQLSVSDAVTELDMTGLPVLVFRHAAHGGINVVYRRTDGHFGWIDPSVVTAADAH
jgi:ribosomal subunit interface protein